MNQYSMIKKLGLGVIRLDAGNGAEAFVNADDLERVLSESKVVYGNYSATAYWTEADVSGICYSKNIHQARLICVEEIKPVVVSNYSGQSNIVLATPATDALLDKVESSSINLELKYAIVEALKEIREIISRVK